MVQQKVEANAGSVLGDLSVVTAAGFAGSPRIIFDDSFPTGKIAVLLALTKAKLALYRWYAARTI